MNVLRIVFMGSPALAVPSLTALLEAGYDIVGVVSQPARPSGRGQTVCDSGVAACATERGLPTFCTPTLRGDDVFEWVRAPSPEVIVVVAFAALVPRRLLELPPLGCVNLHPSLLPRHRGPAPIQGALLCGDAQTGVSIMLLERRLDAGPVLAQEAVEIAPEDTAATLTDRLSAMGARLLARTLPEWAAGSIVPLPQDEAHATYTRLVSKDDGRVDWSRPAVEIWRAWRAYTPWPSLFTFWHGKRLKVLACEPLSEWENATPGTVAQRGDVVAVSAGAGALRLLSVQLEGKKPADALSFVRGQRGFVGAVLG